MSSTRLDPAILPLVDQVPFEVLDADTLGVIRETPLLPPGELSDAVERTDHVVSAAALALLVRDRGEHTLDWQLLDCPMLDDRQRTPSSRADGLLVWSRESNAFGWKSYLGDLYGAGDVPYHAAPARAEDLSGLPPAYVCVGGADGFRDEDIDYALRLNGAGVECELHVYPGAPHGVVLFATTGVAQRYQRDQNDWLARKLRG